MKTQLLFLLVLILLLSSCSRGDSVISIAEGTTACPREEVLFGDLYANSSSKKFHIYRDCKYLKNSDPENITQLSDTSEIRESLYDIGYTLCDNCRFRIN